MKHTPGPWKIRKCVCGKCRDFWVEPPGKFCQGSGFNEDDARLIAAAPEQNEALRDLVSAVEREWGGGNEHSLHVEKALEKARAAIAKAEGGTP